MLVLNMVQLNTTTLIWLVTVNGLFCTIIATALGSSIDGWKTFSTHFSWQMTNVVCHVVSFLFHRGLAITYILLLTRNHKRFRYLHNSILARAIQRPKASVNLITRIGHLPCFSSIPFLSFKTFWKMLNWIQLVTWGVTNRDVLLFGTIWYQYIWPVKVFFNILDG